jgi:hypothetical protein
LICFQLPSIRSQFIFTLLEFGARNPVHAHDVQLSRLIATV